MTAVLAAVGCVVALNLLVFAAAYRLGEWRRRRDSLMAVADAVQVTPVALAGLARRSSPEMVGDCAMYESLLRTLPDRALIEELTR